MSGDWDEKLAGMRELADWTEQLGDLLQTADAVPDGGHEVAREGLKALRARLNARAGREDQPVLVAALFGPTASGKSTVFRMLTGLEVPAGMGRRPMSYAPCAALPPSEDAEALARALFPGFECLPLRDPEELAQQPPAQNTIYFAEQRREAADGTLPFCLVDVPDFDTVVRLNEKRARQVLQRAEAVIFTVSSEKYSDIISMRFLHLCCEEAGRLVVLFTRLEELVHGWSHWKDLLEQARANPSFDGPRADGRKLHQFLADAAVYCSQTLPKGQKLKPADLHPLREGGTPLPEVLGGLQGREILLAALANPARLAAREAWSCLGSIEHARTRHDTRIATARGVLREHLGLAIEGVPPAAELERERQQIARKLGYRPSLLQMYRRLQVRMKEHGSPAVVPEAALSTRVLGDVLGRVHDGWRKAFPELARPGKPLSRERFQSRLEEILAEPLPQPETHWRDDLETALVEWASHKMNLKGRAGAVKRWGPVGGTAFFVADLALTSGVSTAAWGALAAGGLIQSYGWLEDSQFDRRMHDTLHAWRERRREQIARHLEQRLAEPLFLADWLARRQALDRVDAARIEALCEEFGGKEDPGV